MPETYSNRFARIMGPRPTSVQTENFPATIGAARAQGRLRGLLSTIQMDREARHEALALRKMDAALARQTSTEDLALAREQRMEDQFNRTQERMTASEEARNRHTALMEALTVKKATREESEQARTDAERARFEPIHRALMGETVPGVQVDPETLDTTLLVGDKPHSLPGRFVGPMLEKHYGYKYKAAGEDKEAVADATSRVSDLVRQSGVKLAPSDVTRLGKVAAKNPSLLDGLQAELEKEVELQKETARAKGLLSAGETFPWTGLKKDVRSRWNPARLFSDKPEVVTLGGFDEKDKPMLLPMDPDKAAKAGLPIVRKERGQYFVDDKAVEVPKPLGALLDRLQPRATTPTAAPSATASPQQFQEGDRRRSRSTGRTQVYKMGEWIDEGT